MNGRITRASTGIIAAALAWLPIGADEPLIGTPVGACGDVLDQDTTLLESFGVDPHELPALTDGQLTAVAGVRPNTTTVQQMAIARVVLWDGVLAYRVMIDGDVASIPPESGTWRVGRVTHRDTGDAFDVVRWHDVDDGSATLYFRPGATTLCFVGE